MLSLSGLSGPRHVCTLRRWGRGRDHRAGFAAFRDIGDRDAYGWCLCRASLHPCRRRRQARLLRNGEGARALYQDAGHELFKVAVRSLEEVSRHVLEKANVKPEELDLFIPHQANQRITDAVRERLGVAPEKVYSNISRIGNTSSASIPLCLDECVRSGRIKKGDLILMSAFGAGVTWGAALMRW